jgi:hypothetical protein
MKKISAEHLANFAGLVAKCWNDQNLHRRYRADPVKVLSEHDIVLPEGVPAPVIPSLPEAGPVTGLMAVPYVFNNLTFDNWDVTIQDLSGGTSAGVQSRSAVERLKISTLACVACPYSCFSSISE